MTSNMACVEYCEHRIEEAKEKLKENNMRHGYLRLAEVLKKEHKSEKHKKLEKMALDILITSLGRSLNPGTVDFLWSSTSTEMERTVKL